MRLLIRYILNYYLAIDQMLNAILLGHPDETLSSRLGRTVGDNHRYFWVKWLRALIDSLFFLDVENDFTRGEVIRHCEKSIMPLEQLNFRTVVDYEIWSWSKR